MGWRQGRRGSHDFPIIFTVCNRVVDEKHSEYFKITKKMPNHVTVVYPIYGIIRCKAQRIQLRLDSPNSTGHPPQPPEEMR